MNKYQARMVWVVVLSVVVVWGCGEENAQGPSVINIVDGSEDGEGDTGASEPDTTADDVDRPDTHGFDGNTQEDVEDISPDVCEAATCEELGVECGSAPDGCGRSVNCGGCETNEECIENQCELIDICELEGAQCGEIPDGLGG